MGLTPVFVGFSSTDLLYYRTMQMWKANENINLEFRDCQLRQEIYSEDEHYIKRKCRERINMASKFIQLIGKDTRYKYKYVRWEAEVAIEKGCTIIGVNINNSRYMDEKTCPPVIRDIGAIFVPFHPRIIQFAINDHKMMGSGAYYYKDVVYHKLELEQFLS